MARWIGTIFASCCAATGVHAGAIDHAGLAQADLLARSYSDQAVALARLVTAATRVECVADSVALRSKPSKRYGSWLTRCSDGRDFVVFVPVKSKDRGAVIPCTTAERMAFHCLPAGSTIGAGHALQ